MSSEDIPQKIQPFDSFHAVYTTLVRLGCYKLLYKPTNRWKLYFHYLYRLFCFACILFFMVQHVCFFVLYSKDVDTMVNILASAIPQFNLLTKYLTLYLETSRLDKLQEVLNGPYFSAKMDKDEEILNQNKNEMNRLMKIIVSGITVSAFIWSLAYFSKRIQGETVIVPLILPVDTSTWLGFTVSVVTMVGLGVYLGIGQISMDCLVATYYSHATTQLKILKNNLEHMFDGDEAQKEIVNTSFFRGYIDERDKGIKTHFVYCVKKYDTIVWFTKEVNSVFNFSMTFQFFTATATSCFVIYALSNQKISAQFIFLVALLFVFQTQVFLYCYYGSLVEFESQSVCQSAYISNWLSLSPKFRQCLLIAMTRWTEPLKTRVSVVIPLSVATSVQIVRSAYTLFTLMSQTAN